MDDSLTSFIEQVSGESHLRVEDDLGGGFVRLRSAEAERRQAKHDIRSTEDIVIEMLRNARDAAARHIFLALSREGDTRSLCMIDDGAGIPEDMQQRIFEARVTSKLDSMHLDAWGVHGRGMALFSIAANAQDARVVASGSGKGSSLVVSTDLTVLSEKADQSSEPILVVEEGGALAFRGPHNINRTIAEFSLEEQDVCQVFCGSPIDVAATLYAFGLATLTKSRRAFCDDLDDLPLVKRLGTAADPASFVSIACSLGLDLSERSARRVLDGHIKPLASYSEIIEGLIKDSSSKAGKRRKKLSVRSIKLQQDDMQVLSAAVKEAYADIARAYYLEADVEPELRVSSDAIHVDIPIVKL